MGSLPLNNLGSLLTVLYCSFPRGSVVKNLPANAGDTGLIPGLGIYPEKKIAAHLAFMPGKSHGQEEPGELPSMGSQKGLT